MGVHRIETANAPMNAALTAPPSKSATHRAAVVAALADGDSAIVRPLDSDDTRATIAALRAFGARVREERGIWAITGFGARPRGGAVVDLGESGSTMRFVAAIAALAGEPTRLEGRGRLAVRPMDELYDALESLGARIERPAGGAVLPATVRGPLTGDRVRLEGRRSSQFVSALLMLAPRIARGLEVEVVPPLVSAEYVEMTREILEAFGVEVGHPSPTVWRVRPTSFSGREVHVEGDWSSASYLLVAAAIVGGRVRLEGLRRDTHQPDRAIVDVLRAVGCEVRQEDDAVEVVGDGRVAGFTLDLAGRPDLAPAAAVLVLFADGPACLTSARHLRHKESDRLDVLRANLVALGRRVHVDGDALVAERGAARGELSGAAVRTASDHRIAMAFAVAGLRLAGITIDDPECARKSYPGFWADLERLRRAQN